MDGTFSFLDLQGTFMDIRYILGISGYIQGYQGTFQGTDGYLKGDEFWPETDTCQDRPTSGTRISKAFRSYPMIFSMGRGMGQTFNLTGACIIMYTQTAHRANFVNFGQKWQNFVEIRPPKIAGSGQSRPKIFFGRRHLIQGKNILQYHVLTPST